MAIAVFPLAYIIWHYSEAPYYFFGVFSNIIWFLWNYFSIKILLQTLFSPWRRMINDEEGGNKIWKIFANLILNSLSRFIGFFMRAFTIILGLAIIFITIIGMILFYVLWIVLPILIPILLFAGLQILLN